MSQTITVTSKDIIKDDEIEPESDFKTNVIPLTMDGLPYAYDSFNEFYDVSHPLSATLHYNITSDWFTGWYIAKHFIKSNATEFKINMIGWITDTNYERVTSLIHGISEYFRVTPNQIYKFVIAWNSPQLISNDGTYSMSKDIKYRTDVKQTTKLTHEWLDYTNTISHEWFDHLDIIIHNTPITRVNHKLLITQLYTLFKCIKLGTLFIMRFPDARDWTTTEHHILAIISLVFGSFRIWITPCARQVYIIAVLMKPKKEDKDKVQKPNIKPMSNSYKRILKLLESKSQIFKIVKSVDKNVFRRIEQDVHNIQMQPSQETGTIWCQDNLDLFMTD